MAIAPKGWTEKSALEGYLFDRGYNAYLSKNFEDIVMTVFLLDNDTQALQSYNDGLRQAYRDNNYYNNYYNNDVCDTPWNEDFQRNEE